MDRFLGSADGSGAAISSWIHTGSEDMVLTTDPNEFNGNSSWKKIRDLGKSYNSNETGVLPIHRYYRDQTKSHFYTRDINELGNGAQGFVYEGIAFYLKNSAPIDLRLRDGHFYQDNTTGALYITFESTLRHIDSWETAKRLFNFTYDPRTGWPNFYINKEDIDKIKGPRGNDITAANRLVHDTGTGRTYFVDGGNYRYIPDMQVFRGYHFNEDAIESKYVRASFAGKQVTITY